LAIGYLVGIGAVAGNSVDFGVYAAAIVAFCVPLAVRTLFAVLVVKARHMVPAGLAWTTVAVAAASAFFTTIYTTVVLVAETDHSRAAATVVASLLEASLWGLVGASYLALRSWVVRHEPR
jgi:hypothetical protein